MNEEGGQDGWEIDALVLRAAGSCGGAKELRAARSERAQFPIVDDQAHAFCTKPCGIPVNGLVHSLLPELGCAPAKAHHLVFHAYRNILMAAQKQARAVVPLCP